MFAVIKFSPIAAPKNSVFGIPPPSALRAFVEVAALNVGEVKSIVKLPDTPTAPPIAVSLCSYKSGSIVPPVKKCVVPTASIAVPPCTVPLNAKLAQLSISPCSLKIGTAYPNPNPISPSAKYKIVLGLLATSYVFAIVIPVAISNFGNQVFNNLKI
jgi:hypothetical protein